MKKYKSRRSMDTNNIRQNSIVKNDSKSIEHFGNNGFNGINNNQSSHSTINDRSSGSGRGLPLNGLVCEELGIVKNNPLLKHYPSLNENQGTINNISNLSNECDEPRAINHEIHQNVKYSFKYVCLTTGS